VVWVVVRSMGLCIGDSTIKKQEQDGVGESIRWDGSKVHIWEVFAIER
jgi:hypothetical protein